MITPAEEAEVLRRTADAVLAESWGVWRLCAYAWLVSRADRISPKKKGKKA